MLMQQNCDCNKPDKEQMMCQINQVSFAINDILLFLDTHPYDSEAMEFYRRYARMRHDLLKEYAKYFGPLIVDTAYESDESKWQWVLQPWPWENQRGRK